MPTARPPLQVEVVTKIPVRNGLGLADPGVTGGISRTVATAQTTAARAAVEVVTDIPGQLRNITPLTFGQKAVQLGKAGMQIGSKVLGVALPKLGLGVLGNLAQDLLFPDPVGLGSDMVGGVKIGSQPKPAPATTPVNSQPIAKPQVATKPFVPSAPTVAPVAAPVTSSSKTQTQTQPLPAPTTTRPQSAPVQTRPKPISFATPEPRSALETPLPSRPKPLNTESPFPLNIVDLNSYGGINLTYPIAQKLIKLPEEISEFLQPSLDQIEFKINELPQTFEQILKNARIETTINLPAKIDLTSQIPVSVDLSKQIPVAVDISKQIPVNLDVTSQLPLKLDLSKQVPVTVDLTKQIPVTMDLTSKIPLSVGLNSQIPFQIDLTKALAATTDLTAKLPFALDLTKGIPVSVDLSKKVPVSVDLSALLQPDSKTSNLKSLQECCESIQQNLKKKAEMFEGRGELVCGEGTTPFSYKGEGLNGIHQLIKIVLGANQQILEKICNLNIEYPLIEGSGVYNCGTLAPIPYFYSGLGFVGIQNQVEQLFKLDKQILTEVCDMGSSPFGSMPDIAGKIEYFGCDNSTQAILYSGSGIEGLSNQVVALTTLVKEVLKISCESSCVPLMPDARFEEFKVTRQLVITWGTEYPTQNGSLWHTSIPQPKSGLEWCKDFENLSLRKGEVCGRIYWQDSAMYTGSYFESEDEAWRVILQLVGLSDATPQKNGLGSIQPRMTKGGAVKRKPANRLLRAVRVVIAEIGSDGEPANLICFTPPREGCP